MTTRIGLISDTHIPGAATQLPPQVYDTFRGMDMIMHAGDMYSTRVLDWLETVAPVIAAEGNGDIGVSKIDPRVKLAQVVRVEGLKIGLVHLMYYPQIPLWSTFGEEVDVVVFGDTHEDFIETKDGVLFVNPGSPTLPGASQRTDLPGTVALLEIDGNSAKAQIIRFDRR